MGFIYILIIGIILTMVIAFSYGREGFIAMGLILSLLADLVFIATTPIETVGKVEIDRATYELVPLTRIEPNKGYSDNDYIVYTSDETYGVYIIDNDGIIKYKSFSDIEVYYDNKTPELNVINYDYKNGFLRHIYPRLFEADNVVIIPEDSVIQAIAPQIPELKTEVSK